MLGEVECSDLVDFFKVFVPGIGFGHRALGTDPFRYSSSTAHISPMVPL